MSTLLRLDGSVSEVDLPVWHAGEDDPGTAYIVSNAQLEQHHELRTDPRCMGLHLDNTANIEELDARWTFDWSDIDLIVLDFPAFTDGRAYSQAKLLRERFKFSGELRATGDVLCDQLDYLAQCGFSAFVLRDDQSVEQAKKSLQDFSASYTRGAGAKRSIFAARRAG